MSWTYFCPEDHGLIGVGSVDWYGETGCYEWSDTTVFYHPGTEKFYWETGAGCSCNGPLEDVQGLDDLRSGTFFDLVKEVQKELGDVLEGGYMTDHAKGSIAHDVAALFEAALKVRG